MNPKLHSLAAPHAAGISRREALQLGSLLALGLWPGALRAENAGNAGDFTFIVVNDLHYQSERCGVWFEQVVRQMRATEPKADFCLIVGDYCEHGIRSEIVAAREAFEGLGVPAFGVIGNHDYTEPADRSVYDEQFPGRLNYHFEHAGWQFIGLDTTEGRHYKDTLVQADTLGWLDGYLPKLDRQRPTVVFTHFPLGPITPSRPRNADAVLERFREFNLQAVFNGHFHGFTERHQGGATLTTNRCCAISRANHDGSKEKGYFVCQAKGGAVTRKFVEVVPA
jgi:Calcineurin-like phosphoesterase